ncbi:MAG: dihydrolipoamide acetyltransferase family protein [Gammaproteobacteria bacterium]|nr:dihydrolipoamide acetyltransferase family protein [Gammaproteobacteria bacterium]
MPTEIYLVKVGMNMTEGVVEEWYIPDGGAVEVGEFIYRLETEKVNLDVDAEVAGIVKHVVVEGVAMKPGDVVGYVFAVDEQIPDDFPAAGDGQASPAPATPEPAAAAPVAAAPVAQAAKSDGDRILASRAARRLASELGVDIAALTGTGPGGRIVESDVKAAAAAAPAAKAGGRSSPMARKVARELGIDLANVVGTGPNGRITKEDVESAARAPAPTLQPARADQVVPVRGMRKTIATRMHESLQSMAQLTMDMDVVMDDAVKLRGQLIEEWEDEGIRPSYTDLVIRAAAKALEVHPLMNSRFDTSEMTLLGEINVGMAVALDEGLIVPVIRNANILSMKALAQESTRLAVATRDGNLTPDDLQDGTFTVSALGMFGVDSFTPIINSPQVGILGINRLRDDVAWEGAVPVKRQAMRLSLTWDHRAVDGAPAAQFLSAVRDLLQAPYRLLV